MGEAVVVAGSLMAQLTENNTAVSMAIFTKVFFMVFSPREAFLASQHHESGKGCCSPQKILIFIRFSGFGTQ